MLMQTASRTGCSNSRVSGSGFLCGVSFVPPPLPKTGSLRSNQDVLDCCAREAVRLRLFGVAILTTSPRLAAVACRSVFVQDRKRQTQVTISGSPAVCVHGCWVGHCTISIVYVKKEQPDSTVPFDYIDTLIHEYT